MSVEVLIRSAPLPFCMRTPKIFNAKPKECVTGDDDNEEVGEGRDENNDVN